MSKAAAHLRRIPAIVFVGLLWLVSGIVVLASAVAFLGALVVIISVLMDVGDVDNLGDYLQPAWISVVAAPVGCIAGLFCLRWFWRLAENLVEKYWEDDWDRWTKWKSDRILRAR